MLFAGGEIMETVFLDVGYRGGVICCGSLLGGSFMGFQDVAFLFFRR